MHPYMDHGGRQAQRRHAATRRDVLGLAALGLVANGLKPLHAQSAGRMVWASHVSLSPAWLDPAETAGIITPFMLLYALHDALMKPMPQNPTELCLADSYVAAENGLSHEFTLRADIPFHNGETVTAQDVRFSYERNHGSAASFLKSRIKAVETPDPRRVIFRLHQPWADFLTYYAGVTGASWIVPRKYVESVGDDGFRKAPIGAGPYKFASFNPGVELVMEAFDDYWRGPPTVKTLVWKVIPDETTRLAALKRNEVDIAYSIRGELAEELRRTSFLTLQPTVLNGSQWIYFADQWDPKSRWHDPRMRKAVSLALDRDGINDALTLGYSLITNSIVPKDYDGYWQPPRTHYDPDGARKLLAEAGFPNGLDGGAYFCDASYANLAEAVLNNLQEIGIRLTLRPFERAAFIKEYSEKRLHSLVQGGSGAFGNAATRMEAFVARDGAYVYGSDPDIDQLFAAQSSEPDPVRRKAILAQMQQLVHERTIYAPIWQLAFLNGQGPRVEQSGIGLISGHPYSAPYESIRLKNGA